MKKRDETARRWPLQRADSARRPPTASRLKGSGKGGSASPWVWIGARSLELMGPGESRWIGKRLLGKKPGAIFAELCRSWQSQESRSLVVAVRNDVKEGSPLRATSWNRQWSSIGARA